MKLLSKAKINLTLDIFGKLPDNYHRIKSLVLKIPLFDIIDIKEGKSGIFFEGENVGENNTVRLALDLFLKEIKAKRDVFISIKKVIPSGSGLGGASSDAATVLNALNSVFGYPLDFERILEIGTKVGSDVPLFLRSENLLLIENKGERVMPIYVKDREFFLAVIFPNFKLKTKDVYSLVDSYSYFNTATDTVLDKLISGEDFIPYLKNDLDKFATKINPKLSEIRKKIEKFSPENLVLTGSGSSYVAFFKNPDPLFLLQNEVLPQGFQVFLFHVLGWERIYRIDKQK